jgi:hypothetical protein
MVVVFVCGAGVEYYSTGGSSRFIKESVQQD